jgi:molecular chaperone GrpE
LSGTNGQSADGQDEEAGTLETIPGEEPHDGSPSSEDDPAEEEPEDELTRVTAARDKLKDQLLRTAADFDNFRKRSKRDLEDAERRGREEILAALLPVVDNLERAVAASSEATDVVAVVEGIRMVLKQFEDVGGRLGIEKIPTVGERFDPNVHDAVHQLETDEHPPGSIVSEVVPGYRMNDRLVRAALVVVARPPSKPNPDEE